ncbi:MAG: TIGR01459 family HAD-type hydrolase [Gammaproteobacteria bacterium]
MGTIKHIPGLESIQRSYDTFLVDAWGVLHDGTDCYPGVKHCLEQLAGQGKRVIVVSNAARRQDAISEELERVGITKNLYQMIVSSGELTWQALRRGSFAKQFGKTGYYLGPERSKSILNGLNFRWLESLEGASFVLNTGAPTGNPPNSNSLAPLLEKMVTRQLPMVCANPDQVAVRSGELGISAGAIARHYQSLGGGPVVYYGKPHAAIYELAMGESTGIDKSRVLMVGDAFETDISGAVNYGIDSLLIAGGIHDSELRPLSEEIVARSAKTYGAKPKYFCRYFSLQG